MSLPLKPFSQEVTTVVVCFLYHTILGVLTEHVICHLVFDPGLDSTYFNAIRVINFVNNASDCGNIQQRFASCIAAIVALDLER